jgi:hypothetical protein
MTASYQELKLAFTDEQKRSTEYKAGMEFERKARQAQEVATASWKSAVTSAEWKGGFKGAAVGALAGYLLKH